MLCYKYAEGADQNTEVIERLAWHAHHKKGSICNENISTARIQIFLPLQVLHLHTLSYKVLPHPVREVAETYLIPLAQTALFNLVSMRTSGVPISFMANLRISLTARGARFLKPLGQKQEPFLQLQETVSIGHLLQHSTTDVF